MKQAKFLAFAVIYLGLTGIVGALPNRDVSEFAIYRVEKGKAVGKEFKYDDLKPSYSFRAKSPHGMLNPEGRIEEWSGQSVRGLFEGVGISAAETRTPVTVVGTDGYLAQMEMRDFFTPDAMLATHASGKKILPSKGGPQLFFPNQDPSLPNELRFEGWGVWYVAAFVVGDMPPEVLLKLPSKKTKTVPVSFKAPQHRTTAKYYPPGHYRTPFETKPVKMGIYNLKQWLAQQTSEKFSKVTAHTYYGADVPITKDLSQFDLVVAWDDTLIPTKFGGPLQICPVGKASQCTFLIREIVLEN